MLKQVRGALKNVVAWFVICLLILAFALWGVPELQQFTQKAPLTVGNVNVGRAEILDEFNRMLTNRRNQSGESYTREQALAEGAPAQIVRALAARTVLDLEAQRMGLAVSDSMVLDYLKSEDQFKNPTTGEFDPSVIQIILQQNGLTEARLKEILKDDLRRGLLVDAIGTGAGAPSAMVQALILRELEQRVVSYVVFTEELAAAAKPATESDLQAYYAANPDKFRTPEYRTFTLVELRNDDFTDGAGIEEAEIRRIYDAARAQQFETPEKRTLYQVTFDTEEKAAQAVASLRAGEPMEAIARSKGFTLANVTFEEIPRTDILDPKVAEAAFAPSLTAGGVADPVKGLFGWTVVQVANVTPAATKSFEDARAEIEEDLTRDATRKRMFDAIDALEQARDEGASLAVAAERAGLTSRTIGPVDQLSFSPDGAIVADVSFEAIAQAFKLEEGEETEAIELAEKAGYMFVQVDAVTAPAVKPYAEVAASVATEWAKNDLKTRTNAAAQKFSDATAGGASFTDAAASLNRAPLTETLERARETEIFSEEFLKTVFNTKKGAVLTGDINIGDGAVVVKIDDVRFALDRIDPATQAQFSQFVSYQIDQELVDAYVSALREDYRVREDSAALDAIFQEAQ